MMDAGAKSLLLYAALRSCATAMRRAVAEGYADHFDIDGEFWHEALDKADAAIELAKDDF